MRIKIRTKLLEAIDDGNMKRFGIDMDKASHWGTTSLVVDVSRLNDALLSEFLGIVKKCRVTGAKILARDIQLWIELQKDKKNIDDKLMRQVQHFESILYERMKENSEKWLYLYHEGRSAYFAHYVCGIRYHEKVETRDSVIPEHVTFVLCWIEQGEEQHKTVKFFYEDIVWKTLREAIARKGLYFETPELRSHYDASAVKYEKIMEHVGEQYWATGIGTDDVDSASHGIRYRWYSNAIALDKEGKPTQVIIDVTRETDEESERRSRGRRENELDLQWWSRRGHTIFDEDGDEIGVDDEEVEERQERVPVHPMLVVFALKKHMRLSVHVDQVTKYKYDKTLGEKLILPK